MKIKVYLSIGYPSAIRGQIINLEKDWGISDEDWNELSNQFKDELILEWANNHIEYWYEEIDD